MPFGPTSFTPTEPKTGSSGPRLREPSIRCARARWGSPAWEGARELEEHEQVKERAEALAIKLAQTYEELRRLLERNPAMKRQMTEG
jgi:hypothetical protein